jgi:hypothetical protein
MNDALGWFLIALVILIVLALGLAYLNIIQLPSFLFPSAQTGDCKNRLGMSYKTSSNVAPNTILSKVNTVLDDMKPLLCKNSDIVSKEAEKARDSGETCSQVKKTLATEFNKADSMLTLPDAMKKSIIDLNNTLIDSVCGSDDKLDVTKLNVLGSDIKGMFC